MMKSLRFTAMEKKGFTLIELLVVISIIALLMSIMLPSLAKVREVAKSVVCRSGLKQISLGAQLWSEDHDGWSVGAFWAKPADTNWHGPIETSIEPYTCATDDDKGDIYVCPSAKQEKEYCFTWDGFDEERQKKVNYGVNGWMVVYMPQGSPGTHGEPGTVSYSYRELGDNDMYGKEHGATKINAVRRPSETLYFTDHGYYYIASSTFNPLVAPDQMSINAASRWHEKKSGQVYGYGNIAWVDGHVSKEPDDFDQTSDSGYEKWRFYIYDH